MTNTQLFIPEKIKVGYQEREDTYTQRLAYVIYYDEKGKLRKQTSWENWIDKGCNGREWCSQKKEHVVNPEKVRGPLPTHDFDNIPTEGFVLNKKVGGVKESWNDWNVRSEYVRVFDPRGFEFEITVPNLLFILQESSSFKGKGLEGEFVYSWDGKDLVLLPVCSNEYKLCREYTELQSKKIKTSDLEEGHIYLTNKQEELVYLGKLNIYDWFWNKKWNQKTRELKEKVHVFYSKENKWNKFKTLKNLSTIKEKISDYPTSEFANIFIEFKSTFIGANIVGFDVLPYTVDTEKFISSYNDSIDHYEKIKDNEYVHYIYKKHYFFESIYVKEQQKTIELNKVVQLNYSSKRTYEDGIEKQLNKDEIKKENFGKLYVKLDLGSQIISLPWEKFNS